MITNGNFFFQVGALLTINSTILLSIFLHDKYSINNNDNDNDKYDISDIII
jgi:hypothetical protein